MKLTTRLTLFATLFLAMGALAFAKEQTAKNTKPVPVELKNQTNCPVMGGKIDSTFYTDIQGQRVYHCCPMCSKKLKADPDKYFKKAAAEGVLFENIQTTCPVSGEKLAEKEIFTDYEGRRIYFCCKKCRGTFNEDPQKFLKKMDQTSQPTEQDKKSKKMKMKMEKMDQKDSGHDGQDH